MTVNQAITPLLPSLDSFRSAGIFGHAEVQAAAAIARLEPDTPQSVLLAYALAVRAPLWGHVCVDLATAETTIPVDDPTIELVWPDPTSWIADVEASPLVRTLRADSSGQLQRQPLALEGSRLYLDRYARYERLVAIQLASRAGAVTNAGADPILNRFFSSDPTDKQRSAAAVALGSNLAIIAGGPGTGKTRTVARLLAALLTVADEAGRPTTVALAAPTGKAAARMTEAVRRELADLELTPQVDAQLGEVEASTIHRLLGTTGSNRFVHDRLNPLTNDIVVIDESSMVSLPLMARLLDALRPDAKIVLVGDPFQLASVEAGAVLGDLIDSSNLPDSILRPHTIALDRVHRFGVDSGIAKLATAIREGDASEALRVLRDQRLTDVALIDPTDGSAVAQIEQQAVASATSVIESALRGDAATALLAATEFKILAATKQGPFGVQWWTERITQHCAEVISKADQYNPWYVGRPVIITQNDAVQRVFNGDVGVTLDLEGTRSIALPEQDGIRYLPAVRLGAVDTWWAMTIHKSQGSEFPNVVVTLPAVASPIVSRELLYTGVTRAKASVTIIATESTLRAGIMKQVVRTSGLGLLLRGSA